MTDRLSALDVSFLYLEGRTTPMHVGGLAVFQPPASGFDYERLVALIEERISLVPRYRQKVAWVPGHLANPVWVDDPDFDITYHVRRSGLPRPGNEDQLLEFCARIQSRSLDRSRPLWEMYLVEGLSGGRVAIATKTHHAVVDGISAVDIAQVIMDVAASPRRIPDALWMPKSEPSQRELLLGAVGEMAHRPGAVVDAVRLGIGDVRATASKVTSTVGGISRAIWAVIKPPPSSPLNAVIGEQRRFAVARTSLEDYRRVHREQGATVNDVVLATVAGAVRSWLMFRGEVVSPAATFKAMVPVSLRSAELDDSDESARASGTPPTELGALYVDLPVGEPDPLMRLAQIGFATRVHGESARSVGADAIVAIGGFAPPTLHAMGARVAGSLTRRLYNLLVMNVPGPQLTLYAAGARLLEMFPIVPLGQGQALAIGLTSYDGGVYYGLNADWDAMPDVGVLASLIEESLGELVSSSEASVRDHQLAPVVVGSSDPGERKKAPKAGSSTSKGSGT
jgi:diacylglycerol O-acyltransferase